MLGHSWADVVDANASCLLDSVIIMVSLKDNSFNFITFDLENTNILC